MADKQPRRVKRAPDSVLRDLQIYEHAYDGFDGTDTPEDSPHHASHMLSRAEMNDASVAKLWKPRNFLSKVAEEPVGYLGLARPRISVLRRNEQGALDELDVDVEGDKLIQARCDSFYQDEIRPRQADLVLWQGLYGHSFAKVTYNPGSWKHVEADGSVVDYVGEPGLHVVAYPRIEGGVERATAWRESEDPDLVTSAAVFWFERDFDKIDAAETDQYVKHAQLLYPDRIEWLILDGTGWRLDEDRSQSGTGIDPHPWGVTPIAICWNNGKPDLHDGLDVQKVINRDVYDMNVSQQTVAFPQRWRKGLIPQGGWNRNPLTGQREAVEPLRSGPHVVWDVPETGEVGQLAADPGSYALAKYEQDVMDLATLCRSVAVAKMMSSGETSGSSKAMDTAQLLLPRLREKAEGLGACIRDIFHIAFAMAKADAEIAKLLGIEAGEDLVVQVSFEIDLDKDEQAEALLDQQDRAAKNMSLETYLQRRGFTEAEIRKEVKRLEAEKKAMIDEQAALAVATDPYGGDAAGAPFGAKPKPGGQAGQSGTREASD